MIIQMIQPKNSPRGRVGHVIGYIFDVDANGRANGKKHRDEVRFVGASKSLCCVDPFHPLKNEVIAQLHKRIDLSDIKNAFEAIELKNPRVKETTKHIVFSLREGESLTPSQWYELITYYVEGMGYKDNLWVSVTHHNTKSQHAHLLLSCIENTAPHRKTKDNHNFAKSAKLRDELEKMFGLEADINPFVSECAGQRISNSHFKTKIQCVREQIDKSLARNDSKLTLPNFIDNLAAEGVGCHVTLKNENVLGVSFSLGKECFSAAALGFGYSWPELNRRGVEFRTETDLRRLTYRNKREESITKLIKHANRDHDFINNYDIAETHNLIVPSEDFTTASESSNQDRFWVFKLFTPKIRLLNAIQLTGKHKLAKVLQLRKNLASFYDFVFLKGRAAVRTFTDDILSYGSTVEYLYEASRKNGVFDEVIRDKKNNHCLTETGFLLIAQKSTWNGSGSSAQYELDTAAMRQNSIETDIDEVESLNNPEWVTVLGDYHKRTIDTAAQAERELMVERHTYIDAQDVISNRKDLKLGERIRKPRRRCIDEGFSF